MRFVIVTGNSDIQWCFSQVKGTLDDDVTEGECPCFVFSAFLKVHAFRPITPPQVTLDMGRLGS